jgi:alkylation response protein AidB-like acyl-CoA dehydrogenase
VHFALDPDTEAVRDAVGTFLQKECPPDLVRAAWAGGGMQPATDLWTGLASLGVLGMLAPPAAGGAGMDVLAAAVVLAEAGRVAAPLPLVGTVMVAVPLLAASGDPTGILDEVISGEVVVSVVSEAGAPAAGRADWFITGPRPVLHPRRDVDLVPLRSVDRTRDLAAVMPNGEGTELTPTSVPMAERSALGAAAQLIGLGRGLLDQTVGYVKDRHQFGRPIGSFQAVKHRLADTLLALEMAAPPVWAAAHALDTGAAGREPSVSLAKAMASDAATTAARSALQAHGAMGYTDDYHLHFWLKRVLCLASDHGSSRWHRARIAATLGL